MTTALYPLRLIGSESMARQDRRTGQESHTFRATVYELTANASAAEVVLDQAQRDALTALRVGANT